MSETKFYIHTKQLADLWTTFYSAQNYGFLQSGKTAKIAINLTEEAIVYLT
jgi:hypothetical protein